MPLSSDPSVTYNAPGNALASQALAAATTVTFVVDFSSNSLGGWVQIWNTGGATVATTNGCVVAIYPAGDNVPNYDTQAYQGFTIATVASAVTRQSLGPLPSGKYQITLRNADATNAITVQATSNPIA